MEQVPESIAKAIGLLADRFGTTGSHLWQVLIYQQYLDSWLWLIFLGGFFTWLTRWSYALYKKQPLSSEDAAVYWVITAVCGFILASIVVVNVSGLLNPEYYALMDLKKVIGGK